MSQNELITFAIVCQLFNYFFINYFRLFWIYSLIFITDCFIKFARVIVSRAFIQFITLFIIHWLYLFGVVIYEQYWCFLKYITLSVYYINIFAFFLMMIYKIFILVSVFQVNAVKINYHIWLFFGKFWSHFVNCVFLGKRL